MNSRSHRPSSDCCVCRRDRKVKRGEYHDRKPGECRRRTDPIRDHHHDDEQEARAERGTFGQRARDRDELALENHVEDDRPPDLHCIHGIRDAQNHDLEGEDGTRQAQPRRSPRAVDNERHEHEVDADEHERLEQPAGEAARAAAIPEAEVRFGQCPEQIGAADQGPGGVARTIAQAHGGRARL